MFYISNAPVLEKSFVSGKNNINKEARKIAGDLKIDNRVNKLDEEQAVKDQKPISAIVLNTDDSTLPKVTSARLTRFYCIGN